MPVVRTSRILNRVGAAVKANRILIHPLVFAAFPILSLYAKNLGKGFLTEAVAITAGVLALAALFWALIRLLVKAQYKAAIITSAFFVLFFSYGHAISAFRSLLERVGLLDSARFLVEGRSSSLIWIVLWTALFTGVVVYLVRFTGDLGPSTMFLNVIALTLLGFLIINLAVGSANLSLIPRLRAKVDDLGRKPEPDPPHVDVDTLQHRAFLPMAAGMEVPVPFDLDDLTDLWQEESFTTDLSPDSLPDIYYIIVDAYARSDILKTIYQADNSPFLSYLTEQGFYTASESRANYTQTALSVASTLNLMYLDGVADRVGVYSDDRQPLQAMIRDSRLFELLRTQGYSLVAFASGYGPTELTNADVYRTPASWWNLTEFQEVLVSLTPLSAFREARTSFRRDRILNAFDHLADVTRTDGPVFVFAHITAPHFPFIFGPNGEPLVPPRGIGDRQDYEYDEFIQGYRDQMVFVTKKLRAAIDEILARSSTPPIIIVQSDHGPSARLDPRWDIGSTYLPERMTILNAYYFPNRDYGDLYASITPVNTFRIVLNNYFGADLELLEDRSYFSSWTRPYLFTDVTDRVLAGP